MYSTALQGGPGADSKRRRARCAQGASRRNAPRSDHIVSGRVRRDHPVEVADEDLGVPLEARWMRAMSDIPPRPSKSPMLLILRLAIAGVVIALIGYIFHDVI